MRGVPALGKAFLGRPVGLFAGVLETVESLLKQTGILRLRTPGEIIDGLVDHEVVLRRPQAGVGHAPPAQWPSRLPSATATGWR